MNDVLWERRPADHFTQTGGAGSIGDAFTMS
jgi:hypothetical protein